MSAQLHLEQTQKLIMTQAMQQSLHCLQLSTLELRDFLQDAALSNPLLDVEDLPLGECPPEAVDSSGVDLQESLPIERRENQIWESVHTDSDLSSYVSDRESFTDYLNSQLGQMQLLDTETRIRCQYLVGCLNSAGYLDCSLPELAEELGQSLFSMEQALFVVQDLDPAGVGARSLSECLLLQLVQSSHFNATNIHLVRSGLPLLADGNMAGLAKLLEVSPAEAAEAARVIRSLNPIPSRGFYTASRIPFVVPEAAITIQDGQAIVEMNTHVLPHVRLNTEYCDLLASTDQKDVQLYLREKQAEAKSLLHHLDSRSETLFRVISAIVELQQDHFAHGAPLHPMTMRQLADHLHLSISTISRAVKDKYIQVGGQVVLLRSLFSSSLPTTDGQVASADTAIQHLRRFIAAEDPAQPLSDESLRHALEGVGISLSRRTIAKYRAELQIPAAKDRRRK